MNSNRQLSLCFVLLFAAFIVVDQPASAQISGKTTGETVRTRPDPELDPLGVRVGSMRMYPRIGIYGLYNDNIFAGENTRIDDIALILRPVIEMESEWTRHELLIFAGADFAWHNDFPSEDYEEYTLQAQATIDITRASNFIVLGSWQAVTEARGDPDSRQFSATGCLVGVRDS